MTALRRIWTFIVGTPVDDADDLIGVCARVYDEEQPAGGWEW